MAILFCMTLALLSCGSNSGAVDFLKDVRPVLVQYCITCHSTEKQKGELDLERFTSMELVQREPNVWQHALDQFRDGEMPPKDSPQPSAGQMKRLTSWMLETLDLISMANAGDPGPVVLRRLSNMEYTYTIRDLCDVESFDPAREFPVDGAAGEGFTNAGAALVMSPTLLTKYLDAAKEIANHAVLTPDGLRFSPSTSSRDWTNDSLARIRSLYALYSGGNSGTPVNLQGIQFDTNADGRLPINKYLAALVHERLPLTQGKGSMADVANTSGLSPKYLGLLWAMLHDQKPSILLDSLRIKWREGTLAEADIETWQKSLWRFASVGHLGKVGGPKAWMEPVTPLATQSEIRLKLAAPADGSDLTLYLSTGDAGDGNEHDFALWENARLVAPGRKDLQLRNVRAVLQQLAQRRNEVVATSENCLAAATDAEQAIERTDVTRLAEKHSVDPQVLSGWLDYLGIGSAGEPATSNVARRIPIGSLLANWRATSDATQRQQLAKQIPQLLQQDPSTIAAGSPDKLLNSQLLSLNGPLLSTSLHSVMSNDDDDSLSIYGLALSQFGKHPLGGDIDPLSLCVQSPSVIEVRLPASLVDGAEFVATCRLDPISGAEGSVQTQVFTTKPAVQTGLRPSGSTSTVANGAWTSSNPAISFGAPIVVNDGTAVRTRFETAFDDFRQLFPAALCYTKIVPVDEVVTLTLFHREDEPLVRLMLDDAQAAELNRQWNELHFVSQDALTLVDAYEQIWQYSTQDGPNAPDGDKRLAPLREPIMQGAESFKRKLLEAEPNQVQAVLNFAKRAWRRPLSGAEQSELKALYQKLRKQELPHDAAVRMLLARVLVAPTFLYRSEKALPGTKASPIEAWELATRLSYFLWSSVPDDELTAVAATGALRDAEVLVEQTRRMLKSSKIRRLATEFGCQWLHIRDIETLDEKSERHFPTFAALRGDMQEESVRFFIDLFQENRSVLSLLDADISFVNGPLARHYGLDLDGDHWQRVDGLRAKGRGGILGFASTLAKQSGASRTSPILRGNWLSEVVLGEKLPRPPKDVPVLPKEAPAGLTERQLIERHSSDAKCAGCHRRIDPFGFALEGFDAIGRMRTQDTAGLPIDTRTRLPNGDVLEGIDGLRSYLLNSRRDDFVRQFCNKLLGYALGRSIQLSDKPLVESMLARLKSNDYNVFTAVEIIVRSPQFRELRGRDYLASH